MKKTLYVEVKTHKAIKRLSAKNKMPIEEVVRCLIDEGLKQLIAGNLKLEDAR